jgi:thioredoxin 1
MSEPIHVTDAEFQEKVLQASLPVIVDFWAGWCMPCRAIAPALERIAAEYDGRLIVAKVDVDENPEHPQKFGIQGIPTLLMIHQGREVNRIVGAFPEATVKKAVEAFLAQSQAAGSGLAPGSGS